MLHDKKGSEHMLGALSYVQISLSSEKMDSWPEVETKIAALEASLKYLVKYLDAEPYRQVLICTQTLP